MLNSLITPFTAVESDTPDELPGINYWIEDGNNEVVLEVVTTTHDNDDYGEQIADALNKVAILTKALQELSTEVNNLQAQISGSSDFNALKNAVSGSS